MISLEELVKLLDASLRQKGLFVQNNTSHYALPPETKYDDYDEVYREYRFMRKIFTVIIRKTGDEYWVRCGYKDSVESQTVNGLSGRDVTSRRVCVVIDHCCEHTGKVFDVMDQKG